jgi:hypothetical protein
MWDAGERFARIKENKRDPARDREKPKNEKEVKTESSHILVRVQFSIAL